MTPFGNSMLLQEMLSLENVICSLLCITVVSMMLYILSSGLRKPKNFPPGPIGIPVFGSLLYVIPNFSEALPKLGKKYGNIYGLFLSTKPLVAILGYDLIKEVMIDRPKEFASRTNGILGKLTRGNSTKGIASAPYGPCWAAHRKMFHTTLRNMGLTNRGIGKIISDEVSFMIAEFHQAVEQAMSLDPSIFLGSAVLNILAYFTFGNRYSYGDRKFKDLIALNNKYFSLVANQKATFVLSAIPFLHKIWHPQSLKQIIQCGKSIKAFVDSEVVYHRKTLDVSNPRDFIDHYLIEMAESDINFSEEGLQMTILDLFQAGTETTVTTLKWAIIYMANNPDLQQQVQAEIDRVLGKEKCPSYDDRLSMPFTEATILEVQRKANIAPIGLVHVTTDNVQLAGYNLPKGTGIIPCYHSIHASPDHWKSPHTFDPSNFLDDDGKVGSRPAFMPYGGGVRICLGMSIAKQELFVFFSAMLQHFTFSPPEDGQKLDESPVCSLTLSPKPFKVVMQPRVLN